MNPKQVLLRILFILGLVSLSLFAHHASAAEKMPKSKISKLITKYAKKYNLERTYLSCLFKIESSYRLNVVSSTKDHGIGQVNERTAKTLDFNIKKLTTDLEYSMDRSASLLAYYKQLKHEEEPVGWVCRYNVGPGPLTQRNRGANCIKYLERFYACAAGNLVGVL